VAGYWQIPSALRKKNSGANKNATQVEDFQRGFFTALFDASDCKVDEISSPKEDFVTVAFLSWLRRFSASANSSRLAFAGVFRELRIESSAWMLYASPRVSEP
jgi:hypothetical protein